MKKVDELDGLLAAAFAIVSLVLACSGKADASALWMIASVLVCIAIEIENLKK